MIVLILAFSLLTGLGVTLWWFGIGQDVPTNGTVTINGTVFIVEIAATPELREKGLSKHVPLGETEGMLFIFRTPGNHQFWMKGMQFALDIIWIADGKVVSITENALPESFRKLQMFNAGEPITEVLEVNAGTAAKFHIKKGDVVAIKKYSD